MCVAPECDPYKVSRGLQLLQCAHVLTATVSWEVIVIAKATLSSHDLTEVLHNTSLVATVQRHAAGKGLQLQ
jgi:hypothetical protein